MSDETPRTPTEIQADWLATREDTTFSRILAAGAGVLGVMQRDYPAWLERIKFSHESWARSGRPANALPTAAPATGREPVAAPPAPVPIAVPDPTTATMKDLLAAGPMSFNAFKERHPAEFDRLAAGLGMPTSSTRP